MTLVENLRGPTREDRLRRNGLHTTAADVIDELQAILREADRVIVWESDGPSLGRDFQERVDSALAF